MYYGKRYGADKLTFFQSSDIFVFPTFYDNECFPLVLLEAMQAGIPCISTDIGAIPDLLNATGIIVKAGDVPQVVSAIERLITDKELYSKLSQSTNVRFKANYTIEKWEACLLNIFKVITGNNKQNQEM